MRILNTTLMHTGFQMQICRLLTAYARRRGKSWTIDIHSVSCYKEFFLSAETLATPTITPSRHVWTVRDLPLEHFVPLSSTQ